MSRPPINLSIPNLGSRETELLAECIRTGWVSSSGPFVTRFEQMLSEILDGAHVTAVSSGTAALHLAVIAAGVGPDDEVIVPSITFIATCNAVRYVGAYPVIVDVDPNNWQLDPDAVQRFLAEACERDAEGRLVNRVTGRTVRAMMPVHILGHPCDIDRLLEISTAFGLSVIEDAAEALGSKYKGCPVGVQGLVGALSFNGNKIITTGGGGALVTRNDGLSKHARYLSLQAKDDAVRYIHNSIGFNYRMTNTAAAIGCAQLERLDAFVARKKEIANLYTRLLQKIPGIHLMKEAPWAGSTWWLFTVRFDPARFGCDRETVMIRLRDMGVETRPLWEPMHRSKALSDCYNHDVRVADEIHAQALSLPCSTGISDRDVERVATCIEELHHEFAP